MKNDPRSCERNLRKRPEKKFRTSAIGFELASFQCKLVNTV